MRCRPPHAAILLALGLTACADTLPPSAFETDRPVMRPEGFFAGSTASTGVLEDRGGAPTKRFHVEGTGSLLADGTFQLDQTISFEQEAPTTRRWLLQRVDGHHYSGSLTDASGPVTAEAYGNLFHVAYPMKQPVAGRIEQWLYLQPDGRTVTNEATVRLLGIVVARLSERITRRDP